MKNKEMTRLVAESLTDEILSSIPSKCCYNCANLASEGPVFDQPYQEIWCMAGVFDCPENYDELHEESGCEHWKES